MQHNGHYDVDMEQPPIVPIRPKVELEPVIVELDGESIDFGPLTAQHVAGGFLLEYSGRTRDAYQRDLGHWFAFCDRFEIEPLHVERVDVSAYARFLEEADHRSPSTVARRLSAMSSFYEYALFSEIVTRNPVSSVRRPKVGSDSVSTGLSRDELGTLIAAASADGPRSHALVLLLALNGLRVSEALQADVSDLDTERGHRVLRIARKGGKRATAPLAPEPPKPSAR